VALRPTPHPGHADHLPHECKRCYAACQNELLTGEHAICGQCLAAYVKHASSVVRRTFIRSAINGAMISITDAAHFLDDSDTEVVLLATDWIRTQRKEEYFV